MHTLPYFVFGEPDLFDYIPKKDPYKWRRTHKNFQRKKKQNRLHISKKAKRRNR